MTLIVLAAFAVAAVYLSKSDAATSAETSRDVAYVERGAMLQTVIATGVIRPVVGAEINVGSRISGTVRNLPVKVGDRVAAGQLLAQLDPTALEAARDQALADVALARPSVSLAESTLQRRRGLIAAGLATDEDLDIAERDLAVERARLEASQARLRSAEIQLGYARITAPIPGVIAEVSTREGETVAADFSSPTFVTILDLERLEVLVYVDETDIGRIFVGQAATFTVDTYPDADFSASVVAIQPKAELQGNVVNYVARLGLESSERFVLRPEMTAHVQLQVEQRDAALTVPRNTIRRRDGKTFTLVERAGQWVEQEVEIGWRSDNKVEILDGLEEGEALEINPS